MSDELPLYELFDKEFDITYKSPEGAARKFSIEITDAWQEGGFTYIKGLTDRDSELTFRLDRVLGGIPNIDRYIQRNKSTSVGGSQIIFWLVVIAAAIVVFSLVT